MNLALDNRIIELATTGSKAKAISEALRHEGTKTPKGKVPTYGYIQNRLQSLRAKGAIKKNNSKAAFFTPSAAAQGGVNRAYQNISTFVLNVANNAEWSDSKKIDVLKVWFS